MDKYPSDLKIEFKLVVSTRVTQQIERKTDRMSNRVDLRDPPDPKMSIVTNHNQSFSIVINHHQL